jgi:hypothetical protein
MRGGSHLKFSDDDLMPCTATGTQRRFHEKALPVEPDALVEEANSNQRADQSGMTFCAYSGCSLKQP